MQNRVFSGLNYSLGNEDCRVETRLLTEDVGHAVCVAIGGSQLAPFLARRPRALTLVDVSQAQLLFAQLRLKLLQALSYDEFLQFWGYPPHDLSDHGPLRKMIIEQIAFSSPEQKDALNRLMNTAGWQSPLYIGKWERTVVQMSALYRTLLGTKGMEIFDCSTLAEQKAFLQSRFPHYRWKAVVKLASTLAAMYGWMRPEQVPPQTTASRFFTEYERIFDELITTSVAKENFFLQLLLQGKITATQACPLEAQREVYAQAKEWAGECDIRFIEDDVIDYLQKAERKVDYLALSNITSYFLGDRSINYLQSIKASLNGGARIVVRNFLHRAENLQIDGYEDLGSEFRNVLDDECTRVYSMSLLRKI